MEQALTNSETFEYHFCRCRRWLSTSSSIRACNRIMISIPGQILSRFIVKKDMEQTDKNQSRVIITVTDEALPDIEQLANKLTKKGLNVDQVMPMTGVIVASYSENEMPDLKDVDGIMSVEKEMIITLPPADSLLQ